MGAGVDYPRIMVHGWPPSSYQSRAPPNDVATGGRMSIDVAVPGCDDLVGRSLDGFGGGIVGGKGEGGCHCACVQP